MAKKRLLAVKELAHELERSQHPGDPRVLLTDNRQVFEGAPLTTTYNAAVWHRYQKPETTALHRDFAKLVSTLSRPESQVDLSMLTEARIDSKGRVKLIFPAQLESNEYASIRKEFKQMAETYYAMTGIRGIKIHLLPRFHTGMHDHPYPVLNCNWLRQGSIWKNEQGIEQHADEGDWLFQAPGFKHMSPELTEETGMTVIILPENAR